MSLYCVASFFNATATSAIYTLSLHDALPICRTLRRWVKGQGSWVAKAGDVPKAPASAGAPLDRKSTRLNSSHLGISYAVFCLKKKRNATTTKTSTSSQTNIQQTVTRPRIHTI